MKNTGIIVNLADSTERGTHWLAIYAGGKEAAYFDSFGIDPPIQVVKWIRRAGYPELIVNHKEIQNINSGYCGSYCLYFIAFMFKNKQLPFKQRFEMFLAQFH